MPAEGNQPLSASFTAPGDASVQPEAAAVPVEQIVAHIRAEAAAIAPALEAARASARAGVKDELARMQGESAQLAAWGDAFSKNWPRLAAAFTAWRNADTEAIKQTRLAYDARERARAHGALAEYKKDLASLNRLLNVLKKQDGSFLLGRLNPFAVDTLCDALKGGRAARTFKMNMALRFIEWTHPREVKIEGSSAWAAKAARGLIRKIRANPHNRHSLPRNDELIAADDASFAMNIDRERWYRHVCAGDIADRAGLFPPAMPDALARMLPATALSLVRPGDDTTHPYYSWHDLFMTRRGQPDFNATVQDKIKSQIAALAQDAAALRDAGDTADRTAESALRACAVLARLGAFAAEQNGFLLDPLPGSDTEAPPVYASAPEIAALWNQVEDAARVHGVSGNPAVRALMGITAPRAGVPAPQKYEPPVE